MKRTIAAALLATSCVTIPAQYAIQDYDRYPAYRKDIALHNIARIFDSECRWENSFGSSTAAYEVNVGHLYCEQKICEKYMQIPTGNWQSASSCVRMESTSFDIPWLDVIEPRITAWPGGGEYCVNFSVSSRPFDFQARDQRQAQDLVEAIQIYTKMP